MSTSLIQFLSAIGGIIFVDLVLSGDNALVIGAAAVSIPRHLRWLAFLVGGGGAIILRIVFTSFTTFLLALPYLQAIGGLFVLFIAIRLLFDQKAEEVDAGLSTSTSPRLKHAAGFQRFLERHLSPQTVSLIVALTTIIIADITMSLDNIIAIGALAHGQVSILIIGLALSIALLLLGSALVAELLSRLPWLIIVASFILAWVSSNLILQDSTLSFLRPYWLPIYGATFLIIALFTAISRSLQQRRSKQAHSSLIDQSQPIQPNTTSADTSLAADPSVPGHSEH